MKTIRDLVEALRGGKQPVVTFAAGIADKDSYAEAGMRARILGQPAHEDNEVIKLRLDFEEFAAHNAPFESAHYYDKDQVPCLTARQAGYYKPQEDLYFDLDEEMARLMTIEEDAAIALFAAYKAEGAACSYVAWLERKVLAMPSGC